MPHTTSFSLKLQHHSLSITRPSSHQRNTELSSKSIAFIILFFLSTQQQSFPLHHPILSLFSSSSQLHFPHNHQYPPTHYAIASPTSSLHNILILFSFHLYHHLISDPPTSHFFTILFFLPHRPLLHFPITQVYARLSWPHQPTILFPDVHSDNIGHIHHEIIFDDELLIN